MEKDIERYLKNEVDRLGGMCLKFVSPGHAGVPDRIVILPGGRVWFVELKAPGGRVRPLQQWWHKQLRAMGVPSLIIKSRAEAEAYVHKLRNVVMGYEV